MAFALSPSGAPAISEEKVALCHGKLRRGSFFDPLAVDPNREGIGVDPDVREEVVLRHVDLAEVAGVVDRHQATLQAELLIESGVERHRRDEGQ